MIALNFPRRQIKQKRLLAWWWRRHLAGPMIRFLSIRDLAVVDRIEVEFSDGFNVLTGETGAGKSIIVGALGLLVGGRATNDLVRTGCEKAVIEGTFEHLSGDECIVRREISVHGRSRIFIDDALATVGKLKELGRSLVDIHGQHEHQELLDPQNHVRFLDAYAGHGDLVSKVSASYREWRKLQTEFRTLMETIDSRTENLELLEFQLDEIDSVAPLEEEEAVLVLERSRLANAERLVLLAAQTYEELYESDSSVVSSLGKIWRNLDELELIDKSFPESSESRETVSALLAEISEALRSYSLEIETSPERLEFVEERLATLERLKRKYGGSLKAVVKERDDIEIQINGIENAKQTSGDREEGLRHAREVFVSHSEQLSQRRADSARRLKRDFEVEIGELAITDCVFEVRVDAEASDERWNELGVDRVEFFFSANPGEETRALARTASGGELSRVMLALKTLGTTDPARKTLVFDEVDAGVGGAAADRIGQRLGRLGEYFQVLSVTHAPQVAVHGTTHFTVQKSVQANRTVTGIQRLARDEDRALELSRLMTGGADSIGVDTAMALLKAKRKAKAKGESR